MREECPSSNLQMIPIDKIEVLNSRDRNGKVVDVHPKLTRLGV